MDEAAVIVAIVGLLLTVLSGAFGWGVATSRAAARIEAAEKTAAQALATATEATKEIPVILKELNNLLGQLENLAQHVTDRDKEVRKKVNVHRERLAMHDQRFVRIETVLQIGVPKPVRDDYSTPLEVE